MMNKAADPKTFEESAVDETELLLCLRRIGKGMIASGVSVGVVENTLTEIALAYHQPCEIMALPNVILIELGPSAKGRVDLAVQRLTSLQLDQSSELVELVDRVRQKTISLTEAIRVMDRIQAKGPRFNSVMVVLGYLLSCIGLTLLFRPELRSLLVTGTCGTLVGLLIVWFEKRPRFNLLLPIIASTLVSVLVFSLTRRGYVYGSANLLITPLITFLPGALLTTGMIELASMHILSGTSRLVFGIATLVLLFFGIAVGLNLSGLPEHLVYPYEAVAVPWWAPIVGTTLFGVGTFVRLSGANRDLFWMLLVLYVAMLGQMIGEAFFSSYYGAFAGAALMALSSELIARSPRRTPAVVSQALAFWFLVPGARGLLSVTSLLSDDLQSAAVGIGEMVGLIVAITLGVLIGTLIISPHKFVPSTAEAR